MKRLIVLVKRYVALFLTVFGFLFIAHPAYASFLYLSPGSSNIGLGSTISVQVRLNTQNESVNGVTAYLSYPADKYDVTYVSPGSAFSIEAENGFGGGAVKISRGSTAGVTGDVAVATIGLRGKTLGGGTLAFIGGSAAPRTANSTDSLNLGASRGGTFTIVQATPKPSASLIGPKLSDIKVSDVASTSATLSWKTDKKSDSTIEFGLEEGKYMLNTNKNESVTEHSLPLKNSGITPGTKLHYHIISKDGDGNISTSPDQTIQLKGYIVKIKLADNTGVPLKNIKVTLHSDPLLATTDDKGDATFADVTPGKHIALIKGDNFERSSDIAVADTASLDVPQEFKVNVDASALSKLANGEKLKLFGIDLRVLIAVLGLLALTVLTIMILYVKRRTDSIYSLFGAKKQTPPTNMFSDNQNDKPTVYKDDTKS